MRIALRNRLLAAPRTARVLLAGVVGLACWGMVCGMVGLGWTDRFEWVLYDRMMRADAEAYHDSRASGASSGGPAAAAGADPVASPTSPESRRCPPITVVALDEGSLRGLADPKGRATGWPWPRGVYGHVINFCRRGGAGSVGFDILLGPSRGDATEPLFVKAVRDSVTGAPSALPPAAGPSGTPGPTTAPGDGPAPGRRMPVILASGFSDIPDFDLAAAELLPARAIPVEVGPNPPPVWDAAGANPPLPRYLKAGAGVGNVSVRPEGDGVLRRIRPLVRHHDRYYGTLALAMAWELLGRPTVRLADGALFLGDRRVPLDADGQMAVRFNGPAWSTRDQARSQYFHHRAANLIEHELRLTEDDPPSPVDDIPVRPADFAGHVVLVGATAEGLLDLMASPVSDVHPGVEIHANALQNLVENRHVERRWDAPAAKWWWLAVAIPAALAGATLPVLWGLPLTLLMMAGAGLAGWWSFHEAGVAVRLLPILGGIALSFVGGTAAGYTLETGRRTWVQGAFSQFLSAEVLDRLMQDPSRLTLGGSRETCTVFFSDVAGFTALSEQVTPEQLVNLLNRYLTRMSDRLLARGAYIDKFIGDAIMAFWGAPTPAPDHAARACLAALDCVAELEVLVAEFKAEGLPPLAARIGVNTGPLVCGMMGSLRKLNYTVMGDTVNTASRLEGANKTFGTKILTGEETLAAAGDGVVEAREVDLVRVKGRRKPVRLFEILAPAGRLSDRQARCLELYRRGLALYRDRKWAEAEAAFTEADPLDHAGHNPCQVYIGRCREYAAEPPPADWDGVYEMKTK